MERQTRHHGDTCLRAGLSRLSPCARASAVRTPTRKTWSPLCLAALRPPRGRGKENPQFSRCLHEAWLEVSPDSTDEVAVIHNQTRVRRV